MNTQTYTRDIEKEKLEEQQVARKVLLFLRGYAEAEWNAAQLAGDDGDYTEYERLCAAIVELENQLK